MALFLGASLSGTQFTDDRTSRKNCFIIKQFSKPIAQVNYKHFQEKIRENLQESYQNLIKNIDLNDPCVEPICDDYGRVTFFYISLGDQNLPIYQPGTVMFESSVQKDSPS